MFYIKDALEEIFIEGKEYISYFLFGLKCLISKNSRCRIHATFIDVPLS